MNRYSEMTAEERFNVVDKLATQLFETSRWKTAFSKRYGISLQGIDKWRSIGAPLWSCMALEDAIAAKRFEAITQLMAEHIDR